MKKKKPTPEALNKAIAMMIAGIDFFKAKLDDDGKPNLSWQLVFKYLTNEVDSTEQLGWMTNQALLTGAKDVPALHELTVQWRATQAQQAATEEYDRKMLEWKRELKELGETPQLPAKIAPPGPVLVPSLPREEPKIRTPALEAMLKEQLEHAPKLSDEEKQRQVEELERKLGLRKGA